MQHTHGQVRLLFERIAHRYDLLNRLLSFGIDRYWRRKLIASCKDFRRPRVLDVATGTGDVLCAVSALDPALAAGIDLSRAMLDKAREKLASDDRPLVEGAAESLPFKDKTFDLVLVAFGVRNFSRRMDGLHELKRVLRPGGGIRILDFSRPTGPFAGMYIPYFTRVLPRVGRMISGDSFAYTYLPDTVMAFPAQQAFVRELEDAGFTDVSWTPLTQGIVSLYRAQA